MRSDILAAACSPPEHTAEGGVSQSFCFDKDFIGFSGHFEGYPVVPAVTQLLAAQLLAEKLPQQEVVLEAVTHAKFLQQLQPEQTFTVTCKPKQNKPLCYNARIELNGEPASSFLLRFALKEGHDG
jgi:3-hydroxyacyl-[acyl-carrier-protein] dehydratase